MALFQIQELLAGGLRLRTACDLEVKDAGLILKRPAAFALPTLPQIEDALPGMIAAVAAEQGWPADRVTRVTWEAPAKAKKDQAAQANAENGGD